MQTWNRLSLLQQFALTGGGVLLLAVVLVGNWVTSRIEQGVVNSSAAAAALYMDSVISPVSQELAEQDRLSEVAQKAITEILDGTPLGDRVISYKIWSPEGEVLHASNPLLVGQRFAPSDHLRNALAGRVAAEFEHPDAPGTDPESEAERAMGVPMLEIYSPIRQAWSGDVIAVAEFYEIALDLEKDLAAARRTSWLVVVGTFAMAAIALFGIVRSGSRTIAQQQDQLRAQVTETRLLAEENAELSRRATRAAARASAQAERHLRQISADLHDGPGQNLSLAALRLEKVAPDTPEAQAEARTIREALETAMTEIRAISRGLSLPELAHLNLSEVASRSVELMEKQAGRGIDLKISGPDVPFAQSTKIAVFRFIQEGLSNAIRHAPEAPLSVEVTASDCGGFLSVAVIDKGPGFEPDTSLRIRDDGGAGLTGLKDRIESLGGCFDIDSKPGAGTRLSMRLAIAQDGGDD